MKANEQTKTLSHGGLETVKEALYNNAVPQRNFLPAEAADGVSLVRPWVRGGLGVGSRPKPQLIFVGQKCLHDVRA